MNKKFITYYLNKKKERRSNEGSDFDSSSVADLAFLLLIFFIVTSSFILRQGIFVSLPSDSASAQKVKENQLVDVYPTEKSFLVKNKSYTYNTLKTYLIKRNKNTKDLIAVVHMKNNIKYSRLTDSLSVIKEAEVKKYSIKDEE